MTIDKAYSLLDELPNEVKPYVKAMLEASGLTVFDAITSVLFAITTHIDLEQYPILVYLGPRGTGKSEAMKQLFLMCKGAKWIGRRTEAAHRNSLQEGVRTAFVDEADDIETLITDLYTKRYSRQTGTIEVNVPVRGKGYELRPYDIFGATVMAKRTPIADVALRSRAIIIRTSYDLDNYDITNIGNVSAIASDITSRVRQKIRAIGGIDRVQQTWNPLYVTAGEFSMAIWRREALEVMVREAEALAGGQGYEPSDAILQAINILSINPTNDKREDKSVRISDVGRVVKDEFALTLRPNQIKEEAEAKGFQTSTLHGYPVIKVKKELLDALLPEEG
jgi:hypothetical protein